MKIIYSSLILLLLCYFTALAESNVKPQGQAPPFIVLPFQITIVETPETKEKSSIANNAETLLKARDYAGLNALAAKYRASKESYADGAWKLASVYNGLVPAKDKSDTEWTARLSELENWAAAKTNSITAQVALANYWVCYAWKARGSGETNTVTPEGWQLFGKRLIKTMEVLKQSRNLDEHCPYYWDVLLRTAMGLQVKKTQFSSFFTKATSDEPDYKPYYFRRAIYLLPRWFGSPGEWETDLKVSADIAGDEQGDMLYAQVVWNVHKYDNSPFIFKENKLSWARTERGFDLIKKHFPDSLAVESERAQLACLASDRPAARKSFDQLKGKADLSVWVIETNFFYCERWAYK